MISQDSLDTSSVLSQKGISFKESSSRAFLAIDSSTQCASVALSVSGKLIQYEECFRQKSHSEWINGAIERVIGSQEQIEFKNLEFIALVNGPGSFTGLRVATNIAKTISYSFNIPIITKSSLEVLAFQTEIIGQDTIVVMPILNAFKNMIFCGLYIKSNNALKTLLSPQVIEIRSFNEFVMQNKNYFPDNRLVIVGEGVEAYKDSILSTEGIELVRPLNPLDFPLASSLVRMVNENWGQNQLTHWKELLPIYLRASAAEEAAAIKK